MPRAFRAVRSMAIFDLGYLRKWLIIAGLIGIVAGLSAILFIEAIDFATGLFIGKGVGYTPPSPAGEGGEVASEIGRRWVIPIVTTIGGLLSGLIVFLLAPEAEGHGTDAAIEAFHKKEGHIRTRIPFIKLVASAITIGSGGSAGREGPTAQMAAGFGSLLGRVLNLPARDRRIAMVVGVGAGIGAIFKAPLGGAILATEILYLHGFEEDALIPSLIASLVGYSIFTLWAGTTPVFGHASGLEFSDPMSLIWYAILGVACGLIGIFYAKFFYFTRDRFQDLKVPRVLKPAIGGLAVGIMGMFIPEILSMGYGWIQGSMDATTMLPLGMLAILIFAKIVATSLSIGSGGSGGVFAPGLFIGAMVGATIWSAFHGTFGHIPDSPTPFVLVGMMALFGGIAHAPLTVMFMVSEMSGNYTMLVPAMIAVGIAYALVGKISMYEHQVASPRESPAHRYEYSFPLLRELTVEDAMQTRFNLIPKTATIDDAISLLERSKSKALPVTDPESGELVGIFTTSDIFRARAAGMGNRSVTEAMTADPIVTTPWETLDEVFHILSEHDIRSLPVVENREGTQVVVGMIGRSELANAHKDSSDALAAKVRRRRYTPGNAPAVRTNGARKPDPREFEVSKQ